MESLSQHEVQAQAIQLSMCMLLHIVLFTILCNMMDFVKCYFSGSKFLGLSYLSALPICAKIQVKNNISA